MCAYSLDHITPSCLRIIDLRTNQQLQMLGPLGPRLSLTTRLDIPSQNARYIPVFQRTLQRLQRLRSFKSLCVRSSEFCLAPAFARVVGLGGLEPPASPLSGVRSNHLSYRPNSSLRTTYWLGGGACRDRTDDPLLAKQVLSQLI